MSYCSTADAYCRSRASAGSSMGTLLWNLCEANRCQVAARRSLGNAGRAHHHFFAMPIGEKVGKRTGRIGKDSRVDVRGDNGYVIVHAERAP